jgi:hypothetical protein
MALAFEFVVVAHVLTQLFKQRCSSSSVRWET